DKEYLQQSIYRLTYNRILLITSGMGEVTIDKETFEITAGTLFLIAKGQLISLKPNTKFSSYELSFGDCFWERAPSSANNCKAVLFNNASANQTIALHNDDYEELISIFKSLLYE